MDVLAMIIYLMSAGAFLLVTMYLASIMERLKKAGKGIEETLAGLPTEVLTFIIPLLSWLATILYFGELTISRVKTALTSGNIIEIMAALTLIISVTMLLLAIAYYIRNILPALIAVGGFVLGFFIIVFSIYSLIMGHAISFPALIFGILVLMSSYVLGRLRLKLK